MRPVHATFRILIAAAVVVGTAFPGLCRCAQGRSAQFSAGLVARADCCSDGCKSNSCCHGATCASPGHSTQPVEVQALADSARGLEQLAALAPKLVDFEVSVFEPAQLDISPACLAGFTTNLIAQGTRLNI